MTGSLKIQHSIWQNCNHVVIYLHVIYWPDIYTLTRRTILHSFFPLDYHHMYFYLYCTISYVRLPYLIHSCPISQWGDSLFTLFFEYQSVFFIHFPVFFVKLHPHVHTQAQLKAAADTQTVPDSPSVPAPASHPATPCVDFESLASSLDPVHIPTCSPNSCISLLPDLSPSTSGQLPWSFPLTPFLNPCIYRPLTPCLRVFHLPCPLCLFPSLPIWVLCLQTLQIICLPLHLWKRCRHEKFVQNSCIINPAKFLRLQLAS